MAKMMIRLRIPAHVAAKYPHVFKSAWHLPMQPEEELPMRPAERIRYYKRKESLFVSRIKRRLGLKKK